MNTKLLAPVALAAVLGLSSWAAGAAAPYSDGTPTVNTMPVSASDAPSPKSETGVSMSAKYEAGTAADYAPNGERAASSERAARSRVGPAKMFQLREAAGG